MNLLKLLTLSDATESVSTATQQQQAVEAISNYGIMVVLSAIVVVTFTVMFTQVLKRQDNYDGKMADILTKVSETISDFTVAISDSAREKEKLAEVVSNNTDTNKQMVYMYQRAMEKAEKDDIFFAELRDELRRSGIQQSEVLSIVRELHRGEFASKNQNVGPHIDTNYKQKGEHQ